MKYLPHVNINFFLIKFGQQKIFLNYSYLLTYLLTLRTTVLLEKLTGFQLVKKFPAFYGTPSFITADTGARQLSPF